ncbi:hypothetical protein Dimus_036539 [Dionaea muscipula]
MDIDFLIGNNIRDPDCKRIVVQHRVSLKPMPKQMVMMVKLELAGMEIVYL